MLLHRCNEFMTHLWPSTPNNSNTSPVNCKSFTKIFIATATKQDITMLLYRLRLYLHKAFTSDLIVGGTVHRVYNREPLLSFRVLMLHGGTEGGALITLVTFLFHTYPLKVVFILNYENYVFLICFSIFYLY